MVPLYAAARPPNWAYPFIVHVGLALGLQLRPEEHPAALWARARVYICLVHAQRVWVQMAGPAVEDEDDHSYESCVRLGAALGYERPANINDRSTWLQHLKDRAAQLQATLQGASLASVGLEDFTAKVYKAQ